MGWKYHPKEFSSYEEHVKHLKEKGLAFKSPEECKTYDWLRNYGSIGLTKEHVKRLDNATNTLESLGEHTDAKYLKEIKGKLLEGTPEPKTDKINANAFIEKAAVWISNNCYIPHATLEDFKNHMEGEQGTAAETLGAHLRNLLSPYRTLIGLVNDAVNGDFDTNALKKINCDNIDELIEFSRSDKMENTIWRNENE